MSYGTELDAYCATANFNFCALSLFFQNSEVAKRYFILVWLGIWVQGKMINVITCAENISCMAVLDLISHNFA